MYSIRILFYSYLFVMRADELNAAYNESLDECPVQYRTHCSIQCPPSFPALSVSLFSVFN